MNGGLLAAMLLAMPPQIQVERDEYASGCPDQATLTDSVLAALGTHPSVVNTVRVLFAKDMSGFTATIEVQANNQTLGVRTLRSDAGTCVVLARVVTLVVSMLVTERPTAADQTTPVKTETSSRQTVVAAIPRFLLRIGSEVEAVGSPQWAAGGVIAAGLVLGRFSLEVEAHVLAPTTFSIATGRISSVSGYGLLAGCARYYFTACLVAGAGGQTHVSSGLAEDLHFVVPLGLLGGRLGYMIGMYPGVSLLARVDLFAQLNTTRFISEGVVRWSSPPLLFVFGIDLVLEP